jgi:ADP-heptose:LPS heptosyltransferase
LLHAEGVPPGRFRDALSSFDAAIAYTRSRDLVRGLSDLVPRVVCHDPTPPAGAKHASEWLAEPVAAFGADAARRDLPAHQPTTAEREAAFGLVARMPARFLAIHPGSGSLTKNWPADRFAALAQSLSPDRPWLLVEGPAEEGTTGVLRAVPGVVVAATLPPRVVGAVLATAGLYVGNDSGVSHLAAAWGAPTVALFGPTDAVVWSPVGPSVVVVRSSDNSMESIRLEEVLSAIKSRGKPLNGVSLPRRGDDD